MKAAPSLAAAVLSELDGMFALKAEHRVAARASQSGCCFCLLYSSLTSATV